MSSPVGFSEQLGKPMNTKYLSSGWPIYALAGILSLMISVSALGIPGEKEAQLEKRYGKPVKVEEQSYWEDAKNLFYRWNGYDIEVFLCKGKKDWWRGVSQTETVKKEKGESLSVDEINKWLEWNGAGQKWIVGELVGEHQEPDIPVHPEQMPEKIWHRADKNVFASYGPFGIRFYSQEMNDL
ncbi:MAG: hypothetical protein ABIZ36_06580 [Gemmatimonadaceae bacterium]